MMIPYNVPQGPNMSRRRHFIEFKLVLKNSIKDVSKIPSDDDDKSKRCFILCRRAMCAKKRDDDRYRDRERELPQTPLILANN